MRSSRKRERHWASVSRMLLDVRALDGVPLVDDGRLWLLSRIDECPADPRALASALLAPGVAGRVELARLLGAEEIVEIDEPVLSRWSLSLGALEARRDISELVEEGSRSLRSLRGPDLKAMLRTARATLERLRTLVSIPPRQAIEALGVSQPSPDALVGCLPLRLLALGSWPVDPIALLKQRVAARLSNRSLWNPEGRERVDEAPAARHSD